MTTKKRHATRSPQRPKNRTGIEESQHASEMREIAGGGPPSHDGLARMRRVSIHDADPLGTGPENATLDKLGERLAFERSGTRLYDALLVKFDERGGFSGGPTREELAQFRDEEARHFGLLKDVIEQLGADPTAMTPSADLVAVESAGIVQAITDPRTTLPQSLHAILLAELADHDGWQLLVDVASELGREELADRFRDALAEEENHLESIRRWVSIETMDAIGV